MMLLSDRRLSLCSGCAGFAKKLMREVCVWLIILLSDGISCQGNLLEPVWCVPCMKLACRSRL